MNEQGVNSPTQEILLDFWNAADICIYFFTYGTKLMCIIIIMKSTKVQTLGANTICVCDWSSAGKKMANTTSYGNRSHAVYSYIPW